MTATQDILKQLSEIGQLDRIYQHPAFSQVALEDLLKTLVPVNLFYQEMGGIAGYHRKILSLLDKKQSKLDASFHSPSFIDITCENEATKQAIEWGLESLPFMAEMIPLGGAADRLHLQDETTGNELPAAKLMFAGKTLLERMIDDIQAREILYFQKFGKKIITPIAMMTSYEKNNHFHIEEMLKKNNWYGRPCESIRLFTQPLVPVVNEKGDWVFTDEMKLVLKPGGHGAIWKLALDEGIFSWFESLGKTKLLVRQINNPIAGLDYGLLAFLGHGYKKNKKFGFASCPRLLKSAEGVNVVIAKEKSIVLTNIEYCDFDQHGIEDLPLKESEPYSQFSSNTNLLFGDIAAMMEAVRKCPFPGLILNLKKGSSGRLESTMQNLADVFEEQKKETLSPENTFITYNLRHKTISTTKKAFVNGGNPMETPEMCFYDFMVAARELLDRCGVQLPDKQTFLESLSLGPAFVFLYHPILGPLYSSIQQKIKNGTLGFGSELVLEVRDLLLENLSLQGSLHVHANSFANSRCILKNICIQNKGVQWTHSTPFWKGKYQREESVEINLIGNASFKAEEITLIGSHKFVVEDGHFMHISVNGIEKGKL